VAVGKSEIVVNVWRGRPRPRLRLLAYRFGPRSIHLQHWALFAIGGRGRPPHIHSNQKGKGQSDFSDWPLFMPATTYAPTHLARAVPSALRGLT
jgi:hypothetical protein